MENNQEILKKLAACHAVLNDTHVVYTSGKHGSAYVNKDAIYPHTQLTSELCKKIAENFAHSEVEVVVAPVIGGIILSQWVGYHLTQLTGREVLALYVEKSETPGEFLLKRGYDLLIKNRKTLIVEDVLTTGGSVKKVVELIRPLGADIIGVGALCNRGKVGTQALGDVPALYSILNINLEAWNEDQCPMCKNGVAINTSVGKGREYLNKKKESLNSSGAV